MTQLSTSDEQTRAIGFQFGKTLAPGDVVCLTGDLGAGKTTFTKGIAKALNAPYEPVSPTFTIVNQYDGTPTLYHFDLYRLVSEADLFSIDFDSYLFSGGVLVIEWPELSLPFLDTYYHVDLTYEGDNRRITIIKEQTKR